MIQNDVPVIPGLTVSTNNDKEVVLNWEAPVIPEHGDSITDSFEDYPSNVLTNFGDWTTVDGDKKACHALDLSEVGISNGTPMSFFVFYPDDAGYYSDYYEGIGAHTGKNYLASFSNEDGTDDDWLISPALDGSAQSVSFWVKEYEDYYGLDKYEVLYSTTNTDPASFKSPNADSELTATTSWKQITVSLPEGARYFAIHKKSSGFLFAIDDVTYISGKGGVGRKVTGYNIYRDGKLIGTVAADKLGYTDTAVTEGHHDYQVTVVYDGDESAPMSGQIDISTSISAIAADGADLENGPVYTIGGQLVRATGRGIKDLKPGLYIVNGKKIVVK